jgi:hypothetical protein
MEKKKGPKTVTMTDNKTVLHALALINDCNKYKMDLTTVMLFNKLRTFHRNIILDCVTPIT